MALPSKTQRSNHGPNPNSGPSWKVQLLENYAPGKRGWRSPEDPCESKYLISLHQGIKEEHQMPTVDCHEITIKESS